MRIQKGDRVRFKYDPDDKQTRVGMVRSIKGWWLTPGLIEVQQLGASAGIIIRRCDVVRIIQRRDLVQEWWRYL